MAGCSIDFTRFKDVFLLVYSGFVFTDVDLNIRITRMYKRIKRCFFISLFSIIIPSFSYAAAYSVPACKKGDISLPCDNNRWEFSGDALYYSDGSISDLSRSVNTTGRSLSLTKENADYGWGFRLGTGFYFSTANALLLDWKHFRNTTPEVTDATALIDDFSIHSKFDIINLLLAQKIDIGELFHLGFLEGMQYANLVYDYREQSTSPETSFYSRNYKGGGVRVGVNGSYDFHKTSLLFVKLAYGLQYVDLVDTNTSRSPLSTSFSRDKNQFVTFENDMSIGLSHKTHVLDGQLVSSVSWDALQYGVGYFAWSGLRFGMTYLG